MFTARHPSFTRFKRLALWGYLHQNIREKVAEHITTWLVKHCYILSLFYPQKLVSKILIRSQVLSFSKNLQMFTVSKTWRFPDMGVVIPKSYILDWDCPWNKPSSYWGFPMNMEPPNNATGCRCSLQLPPHPHGGCVHHWLGIPETWGPQQPMRRVVAGYTPLTNPKNGIWKIVLVGICHFWGSIIIF